MQWRRQRRVTHVIGSSNHVLLLARYQDAASGEDDEEEGLRSSYAKGQEHDSGARTYERNAQSGYKPRRAASGTGASGGYANSVTRSHKDESTGTPSQPKIIFNEDEYTKITTPRQDVLFKKGYLSRKKPSASNASTSATPSTTESQSASHSTADGSETTEDQQLLDRDSGAGEYPPMVKPDARLNYGMFYDHASGYYYEYPLMLVGPGPMAAQVAPNVLAAVPCGPVPLRPIEWINPAFVHELAGQPYCMMGYQGGQCAESVAPLDDHQQDIPSLESPNGTCNNSVTGSGSCNGSVAGENEENPDNSTRIAKDDEEQRQEENQDDKQSVEAVQVDENHLENGLDGGPYLEPVLMQQPVHVSHVIPAIPQPYMYPGHYMFGPPLFNVNGVTIQSGRMYRAPNSPAMIAAYTKRKKRRRKRKQKISVLDNAEDEEEEECSSECDDGLPSSRMPCPVCTASSTTTSANPPLNPECNEFQLRTTIPEPQAFVNAIEVDQSSPPMPTDPSPLKSCNCATPEDPALEDGNIVVEEVSSVVESRYEVVEPMCAVLASSSAPESPEEEAEERRRQEPVVEESLTTKEETRKEEACELATMETNCKDERREEGGDVQLEKAQEEPLTNGESELKMSDVETLLKSRSASPNDAKPSRSPSPVVCLSNDLEQTSWNPKPAVASRRKYSKQSSKFVREATPGPDLEEAQQLEKPIEPEPSKTDVANSLEALCTKLGASVVCEKPEDSRKLEQLTRIESIVVGSNEDSGFESQTRLSDYPITEAVTEWLRRANSPDVFVTSRLSSEESETEEEELEEEGPAKNLQGNPTPALSAKRSADNASLSRAAICGEFASDLGKRKRGVKGAKRKLGRKASRRSRNPISEPFSSTDSCKDEELLRGARELAEGDSAAGVRVALSSRMDSKKATGRRRSSRGPRAPVENLGVKMRRIEDEENEEGAVSVRTFEKGEIVVSEEGKLLLTSEYEPVPCVVEELVGAPGCSSQLDAINGNEVAPVARKGSDSIEEKLMMGSLESIEEPDVLECWEVETIEPVITPKRMLQSSGVQCEGEAAEEDGFEAERENLERVEKYYRLARESGTSADEMADMRPTVDSSKTKTVPNSPATVESFCSEEIPVVVPSGGFEDWEKVPIDEAFEAYESCYTGKTRFLSLDSKIFKQRTLYGQEEEGPIPCRAVCCNIQ
ncbi:hypothetical protein KM043_001295 [Ampulex compressa]|nr:hypothetical protein KM043_001295 [Ampulex compressa]